MGPELKITTPRYAVLRWRSSMAANAPDSLNSHKSQEQLLCGLADRCNAATPIVNESFLYPFRFQPDEERMSEGLTEVRSETGTSGVFFIGCM